MPKKKSKTRRPRQAAAPVTQAIVRVAAPIEKPWELNQEQVTILKNAVAKGATDEELKFCLTVSRRYRLDPFKKQIWFVKRWDSSADNGQGGRGANVWTPQVGIDGLLFMSARDHGHDFGSVSEPEFGPIIQASATIKAPEWARVKVFKRGVSEPTVGTVYWEEYAPNVEEKNKWGSYIAPFWRKMPRRMLAKCATALALRQAYPDLGGVYIPEECERMNEDYTPGGREIVTASTGALPSPRQAAQNVLRDKLEPLGLWCSKHARPASQCPADEHSTIELEAFDAAERKLRSSAGAGKSKEEETSAANKGSSIPASTEVSQPSGVPKEPPRQAKKEPPKPIETKYELTIDWSMDRSAPVLTGDVKELVPLIGELRLDWKNDLWHAAAKDIPAIMQIASKNGFLVKEIQPNQVPPGGQQRSAPPPARKPAATEGAVSTPAAPAAGPSTVSGTIERVQLDVKYSIVTLVTKDGKKPAWKCWSKTVSDILLKNLGKLAEVILEARVSKGVTYTNVVGIKSCAGVEYDEDGKTPIIQNRNREAGGQTLF